MRVDCGLFEKGNIGKKENDKRNTECNGGTSICIKYIYIFLHRSFLNIKANSKHTIANNKSVINTNHFLLPDTFEKFGTIKTIPNQPAERLTNKSERTPANTGSIRI